MNRRTFLTGLTAASAAALTPAIAHRAKTHGDGVALYSAKHPEPNALEWQSMYQQGEVVTRWFRDELIEDGVLDGIEHTIIDRMPHADYSLVRYVRS